MYGYYNPQMFTGSPAQMGEASDLRYTVPMDKPDTLALHQIVHSSDKFGPYAHTPNPYRDLTSTYDPSVQVKLDYIKNKYEL